MRVCVLGAGAIGGYFGARLLEAGRDVTFLVRAPRAALLAERGLRVKSRFGDVHISDPPTVTADAVPGPFGLVILSCKAYDLDDAMASIAPAVGPDTAILPLLNGMSHLDRLEERFGAARVLGGQCVIGATLDADGTVVHLNDAHAVTYGERDGGRTPRIDAIEAVMTGAKFMSRPSVEIVQEMWEKWIFLGSLAAGSCLMRAPVGDIVAAPGGRDFMLGLVAEACAVAAASGHPIRDKVAERTRSGLTAEGSPMAASMSRDIGNGTRVEADHVIGDLIGRGREAAEPVRMPHFEAAYTHLKAYEARRAREGAKA